MKNIFLIGFLILATLSCKAQNILPVEELVNYWGTNEGIPKNITYVKDVNNILNKFTGTWKGNYNNLNYEFSVFKITRLSKIRPLTFDELIMKHKITDSNGIVIEDTTTLPDDSVYVIKGRYLAKTGSYVLSYIGKDSNCGQNGTVFIGILSGTRETKMQLFLYPDGETIDCNKQGVTQILPTEVITLTKQ
ncbi:MAG: hypothetical protein Q8J84_04020 [Flavobacteriaceae bacterium]|nr:hypothetical protein [Flavobacteriaceae bacterium]